MRSNVRCMERTAAILIVVCEEMVAKKKLVATRCLTLVFSKAGRIWKLGPLFASLFLARCFAAGPRNQLDLLRRVTSLKQSREVPKYLISMLSLCSSTSEISHMLYANETAALRVWPEAPGGLS